MQLNVFAADYLDQHVDQVYLEKYIFDLNATNVVK